VVNNAKGLNAYEEVISSTTGHGSTFLTLVAGCAQEIVKDESMPKGTGEANSSDQKEEREKALQTNSSDSGSSDMTKKMLADAKKISRATVMADKEEVVIVFKAISILSARGKIHNGGKSSVERSCKLPEKIPDCGG
jgi:hypothetical protein